MKWIFKNGSSKQEPNNIENDILIEGFGESMINNLVNKTKTMEAEINNLNTINNLVLNKDNFRRFLKTRVNTDKFIFENVPSSININNDILNLSVNSAIGWKYVNLTKHGIGRIDDLINLYLDLFLESESENINIDFFYEIYKEYLSNDNLELLIKSTKSDIEPINLQKLSEYDIDFMFPFFDEIKLSNRRIRSSLQANQNENFLSKIGMALDLFNSDNAPEIKKKQSEEYLVLSLYLNFMYMSLLLIDINEEFNVLQKDQYGNELNNVYNEISESISIFYNLSRDSLKNFFKIDNNIKYGVSVGNDLLNTKISREGEEGIYRIIGGSDSIKNKSGLLKGNYPIVVNEFGRINLIETKKRLKQMLIKYPKINKINKNEISMGGFILKESIALESFTEVKDHYYELESQKTSELEKIKNIIKNLANGIPEEEFNELNIFVQKSKKNIANSNKIKSVYGTNRLRNKYEEYQRDALKNILNLKKINEFLGKYKNKIKDEDKISKMKLSTILLAQYYKNMSFFLKKIIKENGINLNLDEVDSKISSGLKQNAEIKRMFTSELANINSLIKIDTVKNTNFNKVNNNSQNSLQIYTPNSRVILRDSFWKQLLENLGQNYIYVPYVKYNLFESNLSSEYGLFNIIKAAIDGKIESSLIPRNKDSIIPGLFITLKSLSTKFNKNGKIMVSNGSVNLNNPKNWRCISYDTIIKWKKLGKDDLRNKIFSFLTILSEYNRFSKIIWSETSVTKNKIKTYCKEIFGNSYSNCNILTTRNNVVINMAKSEDISTI